MSRTDHLPSTPQNLAASVLSPFQIQLNWSPSTQIDIYYIFRSEQVNSVFEQVGVVDVVSFIDNGLTPGKTYYYKVQACNKCGTSDYSNVSIGTTNCFIPSQPFGLTATAVNNNRIDLSWVGVGSYVGYFIQRRSNPGDPFVTIYTTSPGVVSYSDTTVSHNTSYTYQVVASDLCGQSQPSTVITTTTPCNLPATPAYLNVNENLGDAILNWAPVSDGTTYHVERSLPPGSYAPLISLSSTTYSDTTASPGVTYCYRVYASNSCGNGQYSPEACITMPNYPTCSGQIYSWTRDRIGEPGYSVIGTNASDYMALSPSGQIDISNPAIHRIFFGSTTDLDDILIMFKPGETVQETFPFGSSSGGRGEAHYQLPQDCIIFANTSGFFVNPDTYSGGSLIIRRTLKKTFDESGTAHHLVIPEGDGSNTGGGTELFVTAGFTVVDFGSGVDRTLLEQKGFVDEFGVFRFQFTHIICGLGHAYIRNMTCDDGTVSSSSGCVAPYSPSGLRVLSDTPSAVQLVWVDNSSDEIGFVLQRRETTGTYSDYDQTPPNTASYSDVNVIDGQSYCYRVRAMGCVDSTYTNEVCITHTNSSSSSSSSSSSNSSSSSSSSSSTSSSSSGACPSPMYFTATTPDGVIDLAFVPNDSTYSGWTDSYAGFSTIYARMDGWLMQVVNPDNTAHFWDFTASPTDLCPPYDATAWAFNPGDFGTATLTSSAPSSSSSTTFSGFNCGCPANVVASFSGIQLAKCVHSSCFLFPNNGNTCFITINNGNAVPVGFTVPMKQIAPNEWAGQIPSGILNFTPLCVPTLQDEANYPGLYDATRCRCAGGSDTQSSLSPNSDFSGCAPYSLDNTDTSWETHLYAQVTTVKLFYRPSTADFLIICGLCQNNTDFGTFFTGVASAAAPCTTGLSLTNSNTIADSNYSAGGGGSATVTFC